MKYTYFDYLVENPKLYRQSLGISVYVVFFSLFILFSIYLNPKPDKNLSQSKTITGEVQDIKQIEVKRKGRALLHFNREVDVKVLLIKVGDIEFVIEGQVYLDYYNTLISSIDQGDFVKVYYFIDFKDDKIIQQIENNEEVLMSIEYTLHLFLMIKVILLSSFSIFTLAIITLYLKREKHLKGIKERKY